MKPCQARTANYPYGDKAEEMGIVMSVIFASKLDSKLGNITTIRRYLRRKLRQVLSQTRQNVFHRSQEKPSTCDLFINFTLDLVTHMDPYFPD